MTKLRLVETLGYVQEHFDRKTGLWVLCDNYLCYDAVLHRPALCGMPFENELGLQYCQEPIGHQGPHRDKANELY
jgi:hypothetical protein